MWVFKEFLKKAKVSREKAQQPKVEMDFQVTSILTEFNPLLPDINKIIRNKFSLLYSDLTMRMIFPEK